MNKETILQKNIKDALEKAGFSVWRMPVQPLTHTRGGKTFYKKHPLKGFPDLFGFFKNQKGRMFCIEVKTERGVLSDDQVRWQGMLIREGVFHMVGRDVETVLKRIIEADQTCAVCDMLELGYEVAFVDKP